ncbi:RecQ family ATP-dependent DNA helicase [Solibacillus merdavium]|uniref:RecQ family ATP-dependent DNA helicase n=1 Tax=Solibacillus merdavium TaxID=2762218 RepID=A0ABR8XLT8_9BACL|nr:RecQ family ATP-dependent DNA helicase [Solibacillus merdavium]MBD8032913.1 RecQ family ATP-dependent DNA helicase [Solibacillus merdavium]
MHFYNSGYAKLNNHFIIKNIPPKKFESNDNPIFSIIQNIIMRGTPSFATPYILDRLGLSRNYLIDMKNIRIIHPEHTNWNKSIKGDDEKLNYPAKVFYEDLRKNFGKTPFLADLFIAECPITAIVNNSDLEKQSVDFYNPFLKVVIEIDGKSHIDNNQKKLDKFRDKHLKAAGVEVVRLTTKQVADKDYKGLMSILRSQYKLYRGNISMFETYLQNPNEYQLHTQLTEIYRFQMVLIELLKNEVISLNDDDWSFTVNKDQQIESFTIALEDLQKWMIEIAFLLNLEISFPKINIGVKRTKSALHIDLLVGKYWDDLLVDSSIIYVREDYFEEVNNRVINTNYIIEYHLEEEKHKRSLQYVLEVLYGYKEFNSGQLSIIINTLNRNHTVGLLPTGGGKSLTYQMCTFLQPAISFVVAPIKSLMVDQIQNLKFKHYIDCAEYINGDLPVEISSKRLDDYTEGKYLFLIISPERFQQQNFRERLQMIQVKKQIAYAVIDEAHCISEWGHDFRTSYLALANTVRRYAPTAIFMALTATASSKVLLDIRNELSIENKDVITISDFTRKELSFEVIEASKFEKQQKLTEIVYQNLDNNQPLLVFTPFAGGNEGCYKLSNQLRTQLKVNSGFYSGSAPKDFKETDFQSYKDSMQRAFMNNELDVLVATKAFGMGIDKPDIRTVIHYGIPSSLESYYQEAGRAGRDRGDSKCIILFTKDTLTTFQHQVLFGIDTKLEEVESTTRVLQGDLNKVMFLMKKGLKNIDEETNSICEFYEQFLAGHSAVQIANRGDNEKIVYRLALLGLVNDWMIDWKTSKIIVSLNPFDEDTIQSSVFKHIQKYDALFTLEAIYKNSELKEYLTVYSIDNVTTLYKFSYILLKWYNDNVIYSRKQSLKNMYKNVLDFESSDDFQHKLEVYFKRNDDVYFLENTISKPKKIQDWWRIYYVETNDNLSKKNEPEIKDLSITISRFLESYKNDPTLNLIEGITSLINTGALTNDSKKRLSQAISYINELEPEWRRELLVSILNIGNDFLKPNEKTDLSELLILNGFNTYEEIKIIYKEFKDGMSYGELINDLSSQIKEVRVGGEYPWEN